VNRFYCRRIFNIDTHVGMAAAGLISDARSVAEIARDEASSYRLAATLNE
jgi:20S proteasome subunit alpha 7